jgi:membrane protein DedA with SNARE-associated domain
MLENLVQYGINLILGIISSTGYAGVFFLMLLESAVMPVPSEIIMPFAGYVVWKGQMDFWLVVAAGTLGNLAGSLLAYVVGLWLGRAFILKYCKYILLSKEHIFLAERWFKKYGSKVIFISRLLPFVRTVISLPAGVAKMDLKKFIVYTVVGSIPWCFALTYLGVLFGSNWKNVYKMGHYIDAVVVVGVLLFIVWFILKLRKGSRKVKE